MYIVSLGDRHQASSPQVEGYSPEYQDASSRRRRQIQDPLAKTDHLGAERPSGTKEMMEPISEVVHGAGEDHAAV